LRQLPQRCREIFLMSRKDQLNNDEIASRLSISKRTVENQLTTALKHLRVELKRIIMISALFLEQYF
jgi:RNA polymerase sigma-70 factor (ECF subfamily)